MKVIRRVEPPCPCMTKLWDFYELNGREGLVLGLGSLVECDCGTRYTLSDSQRDGKFWIKNVIPVDPQV